MAEAAQDKDPSEGEFDRSIEARERSAIEESRRQLADERQATARYREAALAAQGGQPPAPSDTFLKRGEATLGEYEKSVREAMDARRKAAEQTQPAYQDALRRMQEVEAQPLPTAPTKPTFPAVPTREGSINQTAAKSLFMVASVIGALGMMGGRGRGMLAMRGLTGAIQGFRENNYEKYKASMDEYREQVRQQLDLYQMARDDYMDQINARGRSLDEIYRELSLKAQIYNYPAMQKAADAQDLHGVLKAEEELGKMQAELQKASQADLLAPHKERMAQYQEEIARTHLKTAQTNLEKQKQVAAQKKQTSQRQTDLSKYITRLQKSRDQWEKYRKDQSWWSWDKKETADKNLAAIDKKIKLAEDEMGRLQLSAATLGAQGDVPPGADAGDPLGLFK